LFTKKELRQHFMGLRNGSSAESRALASMVICDEIGRFCTSRRIKHLGVFWPYGSEIDLRPLIQAHPDWTFIFPRVASTKPPRLIWGPEPLEPGMWGLMEPALAQHPDPPVQLLLVPGLAFDRKGFRLGYGGGFYDATLSHLREEIITLAVGFEFQRCESLPSEPQDLPVQALMTEAGLTWF